VVGEDPHRRVKCHPHRDQTRLCAVVQVALDPPQLARLAAHRVVPGLGEVLHTVGQTGGLGGGQQASREAHVQAQHGRGDQERERQLRETEDSGGPLGHRTVHRYERVPVAEPLTKPDGHHQTTYPVQNQSQRHGGEQDADHAVHEQPQRIAPVRSVTEQMLKVAQR
jgi:hypothetical protein